MIGFVDYKIDAVIKFGGSLLSDSYTCQSAINSLVQAAQNGYRLLVIPGGGPTDNTIELLDKTYSFAPNTHHKACALAQDQTGVIICDTCFSNSLVACDNFEDAMHILDNGKVAVLLPSKITFLMNPFEKTWDITSDAMAAWFSWVTSAKKFVVFKSVDGVYVNSKVGLDDYLIKQMSAKELILMGSNAVDVCVAPFLVDKQMNCFIINGARQNELLNLLDNKEFYGTSVIGELTYE